MVGGGEGDGCKRKKLGNLDVGGLQPFHFISPAPVLFSLLSSPLPSLLPISFLFPQLPFLIHRAFSKLKVFVISMGFAAG